MCYTGEGRFETSMGECRIVGHNYKNFNLEMGIYPCHVCMGYPFDSEEAIKNGVNLYTEAELDEIAKKAHKLGLVY